MQGELFKQYYKKMAVQGALKSLLVGLISGFSAIIITSIIIWITGAKITWLLAVVFFVALIGAGVLSYFLKFRPDTKKIAKKLDETGLEERMITMLELKDDDSFIARMQREDAKKSLANVNQALLKFTVGAGVVASIVATSVCAAGGVTVGCLTEAGYIKSLVQIVDDNKEQDKEVYYVVTYDVEGEGYITGEYLQTILKGTDGKEVTAEAEDGWAFKGWKVNDAEDVVNVAPNRKDTKVIQDLKVVAVFEEVDETDPNEPQDLEDQNSSSNGNGNQQGDPGDKGKREDGNGQSQNGDQKPSEQQDPSTGQNGGGQYDEKNKIIDGETNCSGEVYENAKNDAIESMKGDDSMTDEEKQLISDYFDTIKN